MFHKVMDFWFGEFAKANWFKRDAGFDALLAERFSETHARACRCELFEWREYPEGRLAEIIVLDQFSRNLFRDSPLAFANDALALALAQEAVACRDDLALTPVQRSFLYMPYMHSESLRIHEVAVELFSKTGRMDNLEYEYRHKAIIEKFGRYPHRNEVLGRQSTAEEIEFLSTPGSGF